MSRSQFEALLMNRPITLGVLFGTVGTLGILLVYEGLSIVTKLTSTDATQFFSEHLRMPILNALFLAIFVAAMLTPWRVLNPVNGNTLLRTSKLHQGSAWGFRIGFIIGIFAGAPISSFALHLLTSSFPNSSA